MGESSRILRVSRLGRLFPRGFEGWMVATGGLMLSAIAMVTMLAPALSPYDPIKSTVEVNGVKVSLPILTPPGSTIRVESTPSPLTLFFPLGTDQVGRDVLARLLHGSRFVMAVALLSTLLSVFTGAPLGLLSGFAGGRLDRLLSLIMDSVYSFPGLVLAIGIAALLGTGVENMAVAIAVVYIPSYFRVVRGQVLSIKELPYVEAARALGANWLSILARYVFPNVIPSIIVVLSLNFADAILTEAGLSFLGLGIPPPTPDWGFDLNRGREFYLSGHWWIGAFPGLMIVIAVLGFSLVGEGLNEILNPKLRKR